MSYFKIIFRAIFVCKFVLFFFFSLELDGLTSGFSPWCWCAESVHFLHFH